MTAEDLSSATAHRYETKMLHDVKSSTRVRSPPRPDPPMFGRESMEDAVSARAVVSADGEGADDAPRTAPTPTPAASARATTMEDDMEAFFAVFQRVEPQLHAYLSDADRRRIRKSLAPPPLDLSAMLADQATLTIAISVVLTALVFYVCRTPTPRRVGGFRSSSTTTRASSSDDVVSWNIGRLLKPLNRSH